MLEKYTIAEVEAMLKVDSQKAVEVMLRQMQEMHMKAVLMEFACKESNPRESARHGTIARKIADAFERWGGVGNERQETV